MNFNFRSSAFRQFTSLPLGLSLFIAALSAFASGTSAIASDVSGEPKPSANSIATPVASVSPADLQRQQLEEIKMQQATSANQMPANSSGAISQVTSVSQLSDVKPTDWAFQALQSLVERYGVIAGYPDKTYRGNRALTRYEFAAGLNAALDRVNELIASSTADLVRKEDLAALQRLQEQFASELATLRGRVNSLEARAATLQKQQFSTTKLQGEVIFIAADTFGDRALPNNTPRVNTSDNTETFLGYRVRLALPTSFTGKDQLFIRLGANNVPNLTASTGTAQTRLTIDKGSFADGSLFLDALNYRFPLGDKATVWIGLRQLQPVAYASNSNPLVGGTNGAASRFSTHHPTLFRPGFDGAGVGFAYQFNQQFRLSLGYTVDDTQANVPDAGRGIFDGNNLAFAQLTFKPTRDFEGAFSYGRKYFGSNTGFNLTGGTGSIFARNPFGQNATVSDNFGIQFNWAATPKVQIGGWFGYTEAHQVRGGSSDATILNGAVFLAFPDLFAQGNLGGFVIGVPPKNTGNDFRVRSARLVDPDTSLHLEAFYTFRIANGITITPDFYVILNPEHNNANDTIWVGTIRTTFVF
ncbi:MAG: iron uptake porin [Tildeniella nuda ZEHNDER 1965/U140]|jgi:BMFP domain-containing protein YqiC|nr:iron uptake porin [Tildeniella nuda ZEHNDER 1965/U140]